PGEHNWRVYTVPGPVDPGHETWKGDSWKLGGAPAWSTGTYDPATNTTFWTTGNPCGRAADFPGVAFPGFVAGFARTGNGVEAPFARAGHGVISIDEPANAVFAAGNPDEHEMVDHQGRECDAVALTVVRRAHVPNDIARFCVERDDVGVKRAEKNFIAQDGHPAIDAATTGTNIGRQ